MWLLSSSRCGSTPRGLPTAVHRAASAGEAATGWEEHIFVGGVPLRSSHSKVEISLVYCNQRDMTMVKEAQHGRKKSIIVRVARMYAENPGAWKTFGSYARHLTIVFEEVLVEYLLFLIWMLSAC